MMANAKATPYARLVRLPLRWKQTSLEILICYSDCTMVYLVTRSINKNTVRQDILGFEKRPEWLYFLNIDDGIWRSSLWQPFTSESMPSTKIIQLMNKGYFQWIIPLASTGANGVCLDRCIYLALLSLIWNCRNTTNKLPFVFYDYF